MTTAGLGGLKDVARLAAERLRRAFAEAGLKIDAPEDPAALRPAAFRSFLGRHLPAAYRVVAGEIADSRGYLSGPVDCVVLAPAHPSTVDAGSADAVLLGEGVAAAIHLERDLRSKEALERALLDVARVKELWLQAPTAPSSVMIARGGGTQPRRRPYFPVAVLALKGPPLEELAAAVREDAANREVPVAEQVDMIAVLDRGVLYHRKSASDPAAIASASPADAAAPATGLFALEAGAEALYVFLGLLSTALENLEKQGPIFPIYARPFGIELVRAEAGAAPAPLTPSPDLSGALVQQAMRIAASAGTGLPPGFTIPAPAPAATGAPKLAIGADDVQAMVAAAMKSAEKEIAAAQRGAAEAEASARAEAAAARAQVEAASSVSPVDETAEPAPAPAGPYDAGMIFPGEVVPSREPEPEPDER
jgi:hypothetical protein